MLRKLCGFMAAFAMLPMPFWAQGQSLEETYDLELIEGGTAIADVKAYKDQKYNKLFTRTRGWNGGDGVQTIELPNGDVFWTFNDSFYGTVVADRNRTGSNTFPRNSIMVQKSHDGVLGEEDSDLVWLADYVNVKDPDNTKYFCARTHLRHPKASLLPADIRLGQIDQDYFYWAGDMTVQNGKLQVIWNAVDKNMAGCGTAVATYSLEGTEPGGYYLPDIPDYKPQKGNYLYMEDVQHNLQTNPMSFGNTLIEGEDGHIYLYHSVNNYTTVVARTTEMDLKSPLQYYVKTSGNNWEWRDSLPSMDELKASCIVYGNGNLCNMPWVFKYGDWYYMTAQGPYFAREMYIWRSKNPYGPFANKKLLFTLPDHIDKLGSQQYRWLYMINLHTALSREGELVFTSNTDAPEFSDNFNAPGSADYYRPFFYRVYNWQALYGLPTGIGDVKTADPDDDAYYTLQGVRVMRPSKGVYVHKGRKVVFR